MKLADKILRPLSRAVAGTILASGLTTFAVPAAAETEIPLNLHKDLDTFYVSIGVPGTAREQYLVDTGAGYMTITEATRTRLEAAGTATYVRDLQGRMADGRVMRVPVYRLTHITIGDSCRLENVEAAVLPGASRGLFGLSALRKASPFRFSVDPPSLSLSNCGSHLAQTAATATATATAR